MSNDPAVYVVSIILAFIALFLYSKKSGTQVVVTNPLVPAEVKKKEQQEEQAIDQGAQKKKDELEKKVDQDIKNKIDEIEPVTSDLLKKDDGDEINNYLKETGNAVRGEQK